MGQTDFYHEDADVHSASAEYAARFAGRGGAWMLERQTKILLDMLHDVPGSSVLDVGGGHGQIAGPLSENGYAVHCVGSAQEALAGVRNLVEQGRCQASVGELLDLRFAPASFEVVTCFRLLAHCRAWRRLINQLCLTAKREVIVDYPLHRSLNALTPLLFDLKRGLEGNTRPYTLFRGSEVDAQFSACGFERICARKQFFWPMVVHRMSQSAHLCAALEFVPSLLGLTFLFGSPVIACYRRRSVIPVSVPEANAAFALSR